MIKNYKKFIFTIFLLSGFFAIFFIINNEKNERVKEFKENNFNRDVNRSKNYLQALIKEKQNATLAIAIALAQNSDLIKGVENKNLESSFLKAASLKLKEHTNFKNVWFQVIDRNGFSVQRSWTDKKADQISKKRVDLQKLLIEPKTTTTISVGKFDMTFKSIVPIYNTQHDFIGFFEIITHFNSISRKLKKETGVSALILADKKYKEQIIYPFTKKFINDYYVANIDAEPELLRYMSSFGVTKLISKFHKKNYFLLSDINNLVGYYEEPDINSNPMGHFLLFHELSNLDLSKINDIKDIYNLYLLIALMLFSLILYLIYSSQKNIETKRYKFKISFSLLFIFFIFSLAIYLSLKEKFTSDSNFYKKHLIEDSLLEYNSIYDKNRDIANTVYNTIIQDNEVLNYFENGQREKLKKYLLKKFNYLKDNLHVRQLHFHTKDSSSFLRMHKPSKYGDSLIGIRDSVEYVNKYLKPFDSFEEGRIVNGFRFVYPLFNKDKQHIGSIEISFSAKSFISKYKQLFKKDQINFLISQNTINDKVFESEQSNYIKSPVNNFYFDKEILHEANKGDYTVYEQLKDQKAFEYISKQILKGKPFLYHFKENNELIIFIPVTNKINGKIIGSISVTEDDGIVNDINNSFYLFLSISILSIFFILIFIYRELLSKQNLKEQKEINQKILDSQKSIISLTDGTSLVKCNKALLDFFGEKSTKSFKDKYNCICNYFEKDENKQYLQKTMNGKSWVEYLLQNKNSETLAKIKKQSDGSIHIFKVEIHSYGLKNDLYIISLFDITNLKNMEQQVVQSEKMASLGEMIGNIAHQWRQPLSIISTGASGLLIQKENEILSDEVFKETCELIDKNAQFLSKTIDDFRNYIKGDTKIESFGINEDIESFLQLVDPTIKDSNIVILKELENDTMIMGYPRELVQCFINIFNNSKDALNQNNDEDEKFILISQKKTKNGVVVKFIDNGGGIDENIINKVFEPYFTTKHQSQGTGLGLHMTYNLIVNSMKGDIKVSSEEVVFNDKRYNGTCFTITLPLYQD
jgi:nitrogen-specific signal transduction histidine kinase